MQLLHTKVFLWILKNTACSRPKSKNKKIEYLSGGQLVDKTIIFFNFKDYKVQNVINRLEHHDFTFSCRSHSPQPASPLIANLASNDFQKHILRNDLVFLKHTPVKCDQFALLYKAKKEQSQKLNTNLWRCFWEKAPIDCFFSPRPTTLISFNIFNSLSPLKFKSLLAQCLKIVPILQLNRVAANLLGAVSTLLLFKECSALATFIRHLFQKVHYSKHKPYFGFVNQLVNDVFRGEINKFHCLGIRIVFRGKLGVGGNSRKSALKYSIGVFSSSTKAIKINRTLSTIRTKTGTVGFSITLAW